ncbi:MAG TPA: class I SAM-dependent methyltransferase [Campylobacterales bacterium]|nr:class I SAM-dependent methyltransferase [Campylobacterales bacterium]HIO70368.1 class I SAM-dependent methyltransferase [Campylobacterales bacterium]
MKKIWQKEWFGIKFSEFTELDSNKIASPEFYEKFYNVFYERYSSYEDLPLSYKKSKIETAKDILKLSETYDRILSIGAGNGIIEYYILQNSNKKITALEPSDNSRWLKNIDDIDFISGFFPDAVMDKEKFSFGYCSNIDYVFNDEEYRQFLKSIYQYGFEEFYLVEIVSPTNSFKYYLKELLSYVGLYQKGQLWGYLREIKEHINIAKSVGFSEIKHGKHQNGHSWIQLKR